MSKKVESIQEAATVGGPVEPKTYDELVQDIHPVELEDLGPEDFTPHTVEQVTSVHVLDTISCSVSADKAHVMQVLLVAGEKQDDPPRKFGITYPVQQAERMTNVFHEAWIMAARQNAPPGQPLQHLPDRYDIGNSPQRSPDGIQGYAGVCFDAGTPKEYTFVMPNVSALQFAKLLEMAIMPHLTPPEREMWKKVQVEIAKQVQPGLIKTTPSIIRPGTH